MMNDAVKKALDDSPKLYSLPQTLVEVLRVVSDEASGADDLAKVLIKDPAMTTRVLRVVNSPYYGVGRKIGTVSQAVVTLGTRQVTALALSTSVYGLTAKWQSTFDRVRFWRHSLEVAIAARSITEKIGRKNLEEMFVSGLLHDIGLLVMEHSFPDRYGQVWKQALRQGYLVDLEEEAWGTNHARVGQFLLEQWRLPEPICQAVGRHHSVFTPGTDDDELIPAQIVNLANLISHLRIAESQLAHSDLRREDREIIRENLQLSSENLQSIEKRLFSQTVQESKYLEIDVGSPEEILIEANRLLFEQYAAVESLLNENRHIQKQYAGEQVKTGFLESLKAATSAFAEYVDQTSTSIIRKVEEVQDGLKSGAIVDPSGLVAQSAIAIAEEIRAVASVMTDIKRLTETESALYYDQNSAREVEDRIKKELESVSQPAGVS